MGRNFNTPDDSKESSLKMPSKAAMALAAAMAVFSAREAVANAQSLSDSVSNAQPKAECPNQPQVINNYYCGSGNSTPKAPALEEKKEPAAHKVKKAVKPAADAKKKAEPKSETVQEIPFEDDPDYPPTFKFPCRLDQAVDAPSGLKLTEITKSPVPLKVGDRKDGLEITIERVYESFNGIVSLSKGKPGEEDNSIKYELRDPLEQAYTNPNDSGDSMCVFDRTVPPAESTDPTGPDEYKIALLVQETRGVTGATIKDPTFGSNPPNMMTCKVFNVAKSNPHRANMFCWERDRESRVRAYRATLDARATVPAGQPRVHIFRKY